MKQDLTTGTWQDDTGCPISIILVSTSDGAYLIGLSRYGAISATVQSLASLAHNYLCPEFTLRLVVG